MNVFIDYYRHGGHKTRSEALSLTLLEAGHALTMISPDVHVYDYPALWQGPPDWRAPVHIMIGRVPAVGEWAWHPLGERWDRTVTGKEYLIIDGSLDKFKSTTKSSTVLTMGATDALKNTERLMAQMPDNDMVIVKGPNFGRAVYSDCRHHYMIPALNRDGFLRLLGKSERVICGWGQTVFEALYLGCKVIAISTNFDHTLEASRFGMTIRDAWNTAAGIRAGVQNWHTDDTLDLDGAARTVRWIESCFTKQS